MTCRVAVTVQPSVDVTRMSTIGVPGGQSPCGDEWHKPSRPRSVCYVHGCQKRRVSEGIPAVPKFCSECGSALGGAVKFCSECGSAAVSQREPARPNTGEAQLYYQCKHDGCIGRRESRNLDFCPKHLGRGTVARPPAPRGAAAIVCPHCGERGSVSAQRTTTKGTTSLGKTAAAVVTLGFSVPLVGATRKTKVTRLRCRSCGMTWTENR